MQSGATFNTTSGVWDPSTATLESNHYTFAVSKEEKDGAYHDKNGHKVKWTLTVDTSHIDGVVGTDLRVIVQAKDNASTQQASELTNTSTATSRPTYKIDVVPYITGINTQLTSLKKNNPSVYNRTALGHYPVSSSETITFTGFNLSGVSGENPVVAKYQQVAPVAATGDVAAVEEKTEPLSNNGELAASKITKSGEVVLKVGSLYTINNMNNNEAYGTAYETAPTVDSTGTVYKDHNFYNRQPNGDNNNLLTDDVVVDVWQINSQAAVPISGSISQPVMAINPVTHDVGFAFVNGALYYSMPNGSTYSYDNYIGGFDYWTSVAMTYDSLGNSYGTAAGGDINETKADQLKIMTSRWGYADRHAGGYNTATNNLRLELIGQYDYSLNGNTYEGFRNFDKERIRSPSLATGSATSDSTNVYLAYYDAINDEIRFKRGQFKATKAATWNDLNAANKKASFFGDYYGPNTNNTGASEAGDKVLADGNDYSKYRTEHNSWIAGQTSRVYNTSGNTRDAKVITTDNKPVHAGQYVSIAAIPNGGTNDDDAVIAVWWDAYNNQLLYSYNLTPNSIAVGQYTQADTKWTTPVPIFGSNIGEYCKLAVIKEGTGENSHYSVHIAGYDGLNCDVWYAYIPNFTSSSGKKTCIVDSYGLIGTELNIDVALDASGNAIPYISYYAGSCAHPKTAHWAGTTSISSATILNAVDEDEYFSGRWEVSVIPTQSKVSEDHINIGVWKNTSGTITWSTTNGEEPVENNLGETKLDYKEVFTQGTNTGYKTGGHVWGNGSKNPILGYAITKGSGGFIETAQMK